MNRAWYLVLLLGGGWLFAYCGGIGRDGEMAGRTDGADSRTQTAGSDVVGETHGGKLRTRSKNREVHPKPTIEETTDLVRSTIIPSIEFEDHTVAEGIEILNQLIREQGIEPHRLRVVVPPTDPVRDLRIINLEARDIPLAHILKYMCGRTKLRYRVVENGTVEVFAQFTVDHEKSGTESAESEVEFLPVPDAVGKTPAEMDEPDPFAEPE